MMGSLTRAAIVSMVVAGWTAQQAGAPSITGVSPQPFPSGTAQTVTVSGTGFGDRLTLAVTDPAGATAQYREPAISQRQNTQFLASVLFERAGAYRLVVTNGDGTASMPFVVEAKARKASPAIESIKPARPQASQNQQNLTVVGREFVTGVTVMITNPAGSVQTINANAVTDISPTSLTVSAMLELPGRYEIIVTLPSGLTSNSFGFDVGPR